MNKTDRRAISYLSSQVSRTDDPQRRARLAQRLLRTGLRVPDERHTPFSAALVRASARLAVS